MGHKNKKSLIRQVQEKYDSMLAIGQSKYQDKRNNLTSGKIYSWNTYKSYLQHACYFVKWCKENYKCKTLEECRPHASEWIKSREQLSAYTQKLEASALCKLYQLSQDELGISTKRTSRSEIKRSRNKTARDKHFSEKNNKEFVEFCRGTGLRRSEIQKLRGNQLIQKNGRYYLAVTGKGGRYRESPIIGNTESIVKKLQEAGNSKVWETVPANADIHSYRAEYATAIYLSYARPLDQLTQKEKYYCRNDKKGIVYDRAAMLEASKALGHNRISVVGEHYLRF